MATVAYQKEDLSTAKHHLINIYREISNFPKVINQVKRLKLLGKTFVMMLDLIISDDIDVQRIASIGYLVISKAIKKEPKNSLNLIKDRLLLVRVTRKQLKYTINFALNIDIFLPHADSLAEIALIEMEIADIEGNPILYEQVPMFNEWKKEYDTMFKTSKSEIIAKGKENHQKLYSYLQERVIEKGDVKF